MRRSKNRALALLLAMFFEILLFLLILAYFELIPPELTSARREHLRTQAYYLSLAMVQAAWSWLSRVEDTGGSPLQSLTAENTGSLSWPRRYRLDSSSIQGFAPSGEATALGWSADVWLYPEVDTEAGNSPRVFKLRVESAWQGQTVATHEAILRQQTFAKYGFFVDRPPASGFYTAMRDDVYEGEFHINGPLPLYVDSRLFTNFVAPVFRDRVSFTQADVGNPYDGIKYQSGSAKPFDASGNTVTDADGRDRYSKLCSQGRAGFRLETDVAMPATDAGSELPLAKAAWFGSNSSTDTLASAGIPAGLTLRRGASGELTGLYIRGDVREMTLDVQNSSGQSVPRDTQGLIQSGNPVVKVQAESDASAGATRYTRVTELRDSSVVFSVPSGVRLSFEGGPSSLTSAPVPLLPGKTVVARDPGTPGNPTSEALFEVYEGYPNGVIYVDGNIGKVPALTAEQAGGSGVNRDYLHSDSSSVGGLKGVNYGAERTIAVNYARNRYLRLAGNLTRGDAVPGLAPAGRRDGLGVVAYDVVVGREIPRQGDTNPFYLYSLVFAGRRDRNGTTQPGSVIYENWDTLTGWGRLFSYGSYVVGNDRLWGDNGSRGWMPTFRHDRALASSPPPFYPTRGDYKLQAFSEFPKP